MRDRAGRLATALEHLRAACTRARLVAIVVTVVACRADSPPPRESAVWLLDHVRVLGQPALDDCAPGDERRPSLGCTAWTVRLTRDVGPDVPAPGKPVATGPHERDRALLMKASWSRQPPFMLWHPIGSPWIEPPSEVIQPDVQRLTAPDMPRGASLKVQISTRPSLPETVVSGPITVAPGRVLAVGLALDPAAPTDGVEGVEFVLTAVADGQHHELLRRTVRAADGTKGWEDHRIPLDAVAGKATRFRFSTRIVPREGADPSRLVAFPLWGAPVLLAPSTRTDSPPNVILVSLDTLRADHVGAIGGGRSLTPRIDALAAEGVVHENAFTTFPSTTLGHLGMLSCLYPGAIGPVALGRAIPDSIRLLAQHLGRAGWVTGAVTEDVMLAATVGFPRGFASYRELLDIESPVEPSRKVEKTFDAALEWLERHAQERVFLFIHTYAVHGPYTPPAEYRLATFTEGGIERPAAEATGTTALRLAYAAEVRYADAQIGRLIDTLERLGIASRTLIIITSDHGEEFGEHGGVSHSHTVYDELLRVPLVWWAPARLPAGRRVRTPTSHVDLVPTVLEVVGLPPPSDCNGESQAARMRDGTEDLARVVFAEVHPGGPSPFGQVAAHGLDTKWILQKTAPPRLMAYDLRTDPGEQHPLDDPALLERGRQLIAAHERLRPRGAAPAAAQPDEAVDPAMQERLRALGYVQ